MSDDPQNGNLTGDEAVLASEVRYRSLFESAQDGILILDADIRCPRWCCSILSSR